MGGKRIDRESKKIIINTSDPGYEPFPVSIMNRSTYEASTFDPRLGKPATISYKLNKSGCIRLRLVRRDQPNLVVKTLQNWTNQDFGKYGLNWDGRDASGNIVDNKKILVLFEAKDQDKGLQHQEHDERICRDPVLMIKARPNPSQTVRGIFEMHTILPEGTHSFGDKTGCEVRCYIDYKLFKTETFKEGVIEFDMKIDTTTLSNGEHLITVNVDDLHDHIGSAGVKIKVDN